MTEKVIQAVLDCFRQVPGIKLIQNEPYYRQDIFSNNNNEITYYDLYYFGQTSIPKVKNTAISFAIYANYREDLAGYQVGIYPLYLPGVKPLDLALNPKELAKIVKSNREYQLCGKYLNFVNNRMAQLLHHLSIDIGNEIISQDPLTDIRDTILPKTDVDRLKNNQIDFQLKPDNPQDDEILFENLTKARAILQKIKPEQNGILYHLDTAKMKKDLQVDTKMDTDYAYYTEQNTTVTNVAINLTLGTSNRGRLTIIDGNSRKFKTISFKLKGNVFNLVNQLQDKDFF